MTLRLDYNLLVEVTDLSGLSRLQYLDLSHNYLTELNELALEYVQELRVLKVRNNQIAAITDAALQDLWDLQTLDLCFNQITRITIDSGLEYLSSLMLSNNQLDSVMFLRTLRNLDHLDLSFNKLHYLPSRMFTRGHVLQSLNLSHNIISTIDNTAFLSSVQNIIDLSHNRLHMLNNTGWRGIRNLQLHHNYIKYLDRDAFHGLKNLTTLDISVNNLTQLTYHVLVNVPNLEFLNLGWNRRLSTFFKRISTNHNTFSQQSSVLSTVSKLKQLHLDGTGFTDELSTRVFSDLPELTHLTLSHNAITDVTNERVDTLYQLKVLDLSHNQIALPRIQVFSKFRSLTDLDLSGNTFQCVCDLNVFINWMEKSAITIKGREAYTCEGPVEWRHLPITTLNSHTCTQRLDIIIYIMVAGILFIITCIIVTIVVLRRQRKRVPAMENKRLPTNMRYIVIEESCTLPLNKSYKKQWI